MKRSNNISIIYNANPNIHLDYAHCTGSINDFVSTKTKTFSTSTDALNFYYECFSPITGLETLIHSINAINKTVNISSYNRAAF